MYIYIYMYICARKLIRGLSMRLQPGIASVRVPMALPSLECLEPDCTIRKALTKSLEPARFTKAWT